jgi:hypothetical protein
VIMSTVREYTELHVEDALRLAAAWRRSMREVALEYVACRRGTAADCSRERMALCLSQARVARAIAEHFEQLASRWLSRLPSRPAADFGLLL